MKKLFVVVALFVCTNAIAQVAAPKSGFGVAVRSGVSYFTYGFAGSGYRNLSEKSAFILGASLFHEKPMGPHVIFRTQLSYLERSKQSILWLGDDIAFSTPIGTTKQTDRYVAIDMALKRLFGKSKLRPFVQAGVRGDVYLKTNTKYKPFKDTPYSGEWSSSIRNDLYRPINLSGFLGMGFSTKKWDVGLEYNSSFFSVRKQTGRAYDEWHNFRTLNLQVSYRF
jgi:Outer membrane protein beta-barrel domain